MDEFNTQRTATVPDEWLTLQEAATLLGMSPSTVRRWADCGRVPVQRTTGGHRRVARAAVQALAANQPAGDTHRPMPLIPQSAIHNPHSANAPAWYTQLHHSPAAVPMRELGQRLLGLLIQYLVWQGDDSRFLADGRAVGTRYGAVAAAAGVTLSETVQAFLHFRSTFWRMALQIPPVAQATDVPEIIRIAERIEVFMDAVLISAIAGYEHGPAPEAEA
jgi:excisionase family DNA binding protein